jgi:hypothetical protein
MCNRVWSLCSHHLGLSNLPWPANVNYALSVFSAKAGHAFSAKLGMTPVAKLLYLGHTSGSLNIRIFDSHSDR